MRAAGRFDGDRHRAGRTIFYHRLGVWVGSFHFVNRAHKQKNTKGDNKKIDHQRDEVAVIPGHCAGLDRIGGRVEGGAPIFRRLEDDKLV